MCRTSTSVLGSGEKNEVGSVEQAGQHVTGGGNEQLCRGTQEGLGIQFVPFVLVLSAL